VSSFYSWAGRRDDGSDVSLERREKFAAKVQYLQHIVHETKDRWLLLLCVFVLRCFGDSSIRFHITV
jgi:hypothetical protein